jgi:hypothetical protein
MLHCLCRSAQRNGCGYKTYGEDCVPGGRKYLDRHFPDSWAFEGNVPPNRHMLQRNSVSDRLCQEPIARSAASYRPVLYILYLRGRYWAQSKSRKAHYDKFFEGQNKSQN